MVRVEATCSAGGSLLRRACGREAVTTCVYCAEPFCEEHGERGDNYMDVCDRRECVAKRRDLAAHQEWRHEAKRFNDVSMCAEDPCAERMRHQCARCRLMFCEVHVKEFDATDTSVRPPRRVRSLLCQHCNERRRIWE